MGAPRRTSYERLLVRLHETQLPFDDAAERGAVLAVFVAPHEHARRLSRRAYSGHFYCHMHGWLWEQVGMALRKSTGRIDSDSALENWLYKSHLCWRFRDRFQMRLVTFMERYVLKSGFWWHGDYYVDRVIEAAKLRGRVQSTSEDLEKALDAAESWK